MNKVKSTAAYWKDLPNQESLSVRAYVTNPDRPLQAHENTWKEIKDDQPLTVRVKVTGTDSTATVAGFGLAFISTRKERKLQMNARQYKEFIINCWANGYDY